MKTVINCNEVEGTPEEIAKMIGLFSDGKYVAFSDTAVDSDILRKFCQSCSNHPKNGGSGICHCVLGVATNCLTDLT